MHIPGFHGLHPVVVVQRAVRAFIADDMISYAAALAFYVLLAGFPFILFLIALLSFLHLPNFFARFLLLVQLFVPAQVVGLVEPVIREIGTGQSSGLLSLGVATALYSVSVGVRSLMRALNVAYKVPEQRRTWKRYALSISFAFGLAGMLIVSGIIMLVSPRLLAWLAGWVGLSELVLTLWTWLRVPVAMVVLTSAVAVIYYVVPSISHQFRLLTPGALLAVVSWVGASFGFSWYITNIADYSVTYGSLGVAIVLLLYCYLSAALLLLGAEINAVLEQHARESTS